MIQKIFHRPPDEIDLEGLRNECLKEWVLALGNTYPAAFLRTFNEAYNYLMWELDEKYTNPTFEFEVSLSDRFLHLRSVEDEFKYYFNQLTPKEREAYKMNTLTIKDFEV